MYLLAKEAKKLSRLGIQVFVKTRAPQNKDKHSLASVEGTIPTQSDGYFVSDGAKAFAIVIAIKNDGHDDIRLVTPEGEDGKTLNKFLSPQNHSDDGQSIYVRLVSTYDVYEGRSTKPQDNSLTIVSTKKNALRVFSAGVVTRINGNEQSLYFLVIQEMYRAKLYRDTAGQIAVKDSEYDGYKKWPDLQKIVKDLVGDRPLPTLPKARPTAPRLTVEGLEDGQGRVLFFDPRKGFGMALTKSSPEDGVYFHWKQTETEDRLPYFENGQLITYSDIYENSKGRQLLGVKVI